MTEAQIIANDIREQLAKLNALLSKAAESGLTVEINHVSVTDRGDDGWHYMLTTQISKVEAL